MVVKQQIKEINKVRSTLKHLESTASKDDAYGSGRFSEACRGAEDSLHNVLLTARFFLEGEVISDEELKGES
jgi:hypothetical protein